MAAVADGVGRHPDRDASDPLEGHRLRRSRAPRGRRGAALRRVAQGAHQGDAARGRRPDPLGHADPAHPPSQPRRHPRPVGHRDAAGGAPADPDADRRGRRRPRPRRDQPRDRPRRPGLLRPQPGRDDRGGRRARAAPRPRRAGRHRPRPDGRGDARAGDARLQRRPVRRAGLHHDHRVRASTSRTRTPSSSCAPTRSAWPSSTSCAAGSAAPTAAPTPTCSIGAGCRSRRSPASGCTRSSPPPTSAPATRSRLSDLEIRGAGNILGAEQHGFMAAVGFEMYTRLLAEAVDMLRGQRPAPEPAPVRLDLPGSAYLPDDYIADSGAKLEAYRRFAGLRSDADAEALRDRPARPIRTRSRPGRGAVHRRPRSPRRRGGRRARGPCGGPPGDAEVGRTAARPAWR